MSNGMGADSQVGGRYDRQVRLWGPFGQEFMSLTPVVAIGCGVEVQEFLKNLVLPGVGEVTIFDNLPLQGADVDSSLLLEDYPKPGTEVATRGRAIVPGLQALNPDVSVEASEEDPSEVLTRIVTGKWNNRDRERLQRRVPGFRTEIVRPIVVVGSEYALLVETLMSNMDQTKGLEGSSHACLLPSIFVLRSYFFHGSIRVLARGHYVVDDHERDHEEAKGFDLRLPYLTQSFPALKDGLTRLWNEFGTVDDDDTFLHLPWILILVRVQDLFVLEHGRMPTNSDRAAVQDIFDGVCRTRTCGPTGLNFQEARRKIPLLWREMPAWPSPMFQNYLTDACTSVSVERRLDRFQVCLIVLRSFYETFKRYPLTGIIPDMTSSTQHYTQVKALYHAEAVKDFDWFMATAQDILKGHEVQHEDIEEDQFATYVRYFIKHCQFLHYDAIVASPGDPKREGQRILKELVTHCAGDSLNQQQCHLSAAVIGAVAAQEATKVITHQWRPRLYDTMVWNGYSNMMYYVDSLASKQILDQAL